MLSSASCSRGKKIMGTIQVWYQQIFQLSPVGIAIVEIPGGRILDANEKLLRLLEERKEDLLQKSLPEIGFLPSIGGREWVDALIQQGSILNHDLRLVNHARRSLRVTVSVDRVDLDDQSVLLLFVQDMTGRVEMEDTIRRMNDDLERHILERTAAYDAVNRELESEIGLRQAVEESTQRLIRILWETPDMVSISEPGGRFQYVNKAGRRRFGIGDGDSISSWSVFDVYPPELHDFVQHVITPEVHQKGIWFGETEFLLPDGRRMPVEQTLLAHRDEDGRTIFYSSVARDISDQKRASIELEKALSRERELGALRTNFFTMASHQFRTPLSGILSSAELLEYYGASWSDEKRMTHLKRIQDAAHRLNKMLDHILAIGHLEIIPEEALTDTIDLVDLVQRVVDEANDVDGRRHEIHIAVEKPIFCTRTSEELVERVIDNLISNALKYSGVGASIDIRLALECEDALIEIIDHGIGIPNEEHELVFHPFFRGSNIADIEGNGLGLMIVEKALGLLGGKISLSSQMGSGTKAVVRLPIRGGEAR